MSNQKKTYFLCPTWDYHPKGPIQLGNIILSPSTPAEALNGRESLPPAQDTLFPPTTKSGVTWSKEKLSGRYGLWTEFLSFLTGLGVHASVSHDSSAEQAYAFDAIDTTEFIPTRDYLARSMAAPAVVSFLEKSCFRKPVYMITALKVVRGARAKSALSRSLGAELKVGLDGTWTGAPAKFGPEVRVEWNDEESGSFDGSSDFVFAFRLRKVVVHRSGETTHVEYTKGAMHGADGRPAGLQGLPFVVEGLAGEDASAQEFGCGAMAEVVDEDEGCVCVQPEEG
jgi:hypothetical protein